MPDENQNLDPTHEETEGNEVRPGNKPFAQANTDPTPKPTEPTPTPVPPATPAPAETPATQPPAPAQPVAPSPTPEPPKPAAPQPTPPPAPAAAPAKPAATPPPAPVAPVAPAAKPAAPTPPAAAPAAKPAPGTPPKPGVPAPGAVPAKPGVAQPKVTRKPPNPKKLLYGCAGCSSIGVVIFIILVLVFVSQTTASGDNSLARALGMDTGSLINTLIILVNLIFGTLSLILFILAIVGAFRFFMARKDDKETRKKGITLAGISGLLLLIFVFIWIGIYMVITAKQVPTDAPRVGIVTEPESTLGLTAPITIQFDATGVPINTRQYEILSYLWDFGDGNSSTVAITSNTYKDKGPNNGRFDVRLQISARDRNTQEELSETFTTVVTIANVELGAVFTATPEAGNAPLTVEFDASESAAPAGQIVSYEWDFDNNNVFTDADGVKVSHTFEQLGTYKVNLRVTDNTGQFKVSSKDITVAAENVPVAVIDIPTEDGNYYIGKQYSFQGEKSTSPTGSINKYEWDFGDGSAKANTRTATHIYKEFGEYEVILKVTDESGVTGETAKKINVEVQESSPIAVIDTTPGPVGDEDKIAGTVPFEVAFNGGKSQDPDNNIVDYKWDFDGDGQEDAAGERATYVYKESGIFNATLTVVDSENNESKAIMVVQIGAQPLQARVEADTLEGVIPLTVTFDASSSSYPDGQIVSYEWDFGDGSAKRIDVSKVTYKYTKIGTFTASVTAIASDNTRSTTEIPINVRPVSLTACFKATPEVGAAPMEVEFDPNCSTGTIAKYSWDFGDGESTKTRKPKHTFNTPGDYQVVLEVADNQNVISTFTKNILVTGTL